MDRATILKSGSQFLLSTPSPTTSTSPTTSSRDGSSNQLKSREGVRQTVIDIWDWGKTATLCWQDNACDNDYIVMMMTLATMIKSERGTVLVTWEQKQTNEAESWNETQHLWWDFFGNEVWSHLKNWSKLESVKLNIQQGRKGHGYTPQHDHLNDSQHLQWIQIQIWHLFWIHTA